MRWYLIIVVLILSITIVVAQRTTRNRLKTVPRIERAGTYDTIATHVDTAAVTFTGYDKVLRASKESFFVTNNLDVDISRLCLKIVYKDMSGRIYDSRHLTVDTDIQSGQTRRVDVESWDKQKSFYYYRSTVPRVERATPYKVNISLIAALKAAD